MYPPSVLKQVSEQPPLLITHSLISTWDEKRSIHLGVSKKFPVQQHCHFDVNASLIIAGMRFVREKKMLFKCPFLVSIFPSLASSANPAVRIIVITPAPTLSYTLSFTFKKTSAQLTACRRENSRFLLGLSNYALAMIGFKNLVCRRHSKPIGSSGEPLETWLHAYVSRAYSDVLSQSSGLAIGRSLVESCKENWKVYQNMPASMTAYTMKLFIPLQVAPSMSRVNPGRHEQIRP